MKKMAAIAFISIMIAVLNGCRVSTEEIGATTKLSMQQTFMTNRDFQNHHLTVENVLVLKKSENSYKGIASILYNGAIHDVPIEITVDGENVMWEAAPGSFLFIKP